MLLALLDVDQADLDRLPIGGLIQQVEVALELGAVVDEAELLEVLLQGESAVRARTHARTHTHTHTTHKHAPQHIHAQRTGVR